MDDMKLRDRLDEDAARETGAMRALKVLEAMRARATKSFASTELSLILEIGIAEVRGYISEERIPPSGAACDGVPWLLDAVSSERNAAIRKCDELRAELKGKRNDCAIAEKAYEDLHARHEAVVTERNKLRDQLSSATNAEALTPEPPSSLKALVERWRLLSHQRRIALQLGDGDTTDFAQCAAELEDVLAKKRLLLGAIHNSRVQADLEAMRKRAESAEQTLQLIKDNLP